MFINTKYLVGIEKMPTFVISKKEMIGRSNILKYSLQHTYIFLVKID